MRHYSFLSGLVNFAGAVTCRKQ